MQRRQRSPITLTIILAGLLLGAAGCGTILPGGDRGPDTDRADRIVVGEVQHVDEGRREIEISDQGDRVLVGYDDRTEVLYEGRSYRPENLERGDRVRVEAEVTSFEGLRADRVEVLESVSDPGGARDPRDPRDPRDDRDPDRHDREMEHTISGEVEGVDTRDREIRVQTRVRTETLRYDDRTRVFWRGEEYEPANLEAGDLVRIEALEDRDRRLFAERIEVTTARQDRGRDGGFEDDVRGERLEGTVRWIDERRGEFGLRIPSGTVTVELPFDADRTTRDRFERLRSGDRIEIEADELDRERYELLRFR